MEIKLLDSKYNKVLELVEELGKIRLENIDDADLERLREELQEEGYNTYIDSRIDYLVVEKEEED